MNNEKLVIQLETAIGSELLLTMFDVTQPSLVAVKVDLFWQLAVVQIWTFLCKCMGFEELREFFGVFFPCLLYTSDAADES